MLRSCKNQRCNEHMDARLVLMLTFPLLWQSVMYNGKTRVVKSRSTEVKNWPLNLLVSCQIIIHFGFSGLDRSKIHNYSSTLI